MASWPKRLTTILNTVKKNFTYESDILRHGKLEVWSFPTEDYDGRQDLVGDCEDFALAVRKLLNDRKIPSRLVVCRTERGERHLVVEVHGWVIDNRLPKVLSRDALPDYKWLYISGFNPGEPWTKIAA